MKTVNTHGFIRQHYGMGLYRHHFACFACRKMFQPLTGREVYAPDHLRQSRLGHAHRCPDCKGKLHDVGMDFKPPRRRNIRQWDKVRVLYTKGIRWVNRTDGAYGPGHRFRTLKEALDYVPGDPLSK